MNTLFVFSKYGNSDLRIIAKTESEARDRMRFIMSSEIYNDFFNTNNIYMEIVDDYETRYGGRI